MRSLLRLVSFLLPAMLMALSLQAATVYWTGADGDLFDDPTKWSPNLPVAGDSTAFCIGTTSELSTPFAPTLATVYVGYNDAGSHAGNGGLNVSGAGAISSTGSLVAGYDGYTGTINVPGGSIAGGSYLYVGYTTATTQPAGVGYYTQSGGTATFASTVRIGYRSGQGHVALSGGTLTTGGGYVVGYSAEGTAESLQTGGTLNVGDTFIAGYGKASTATMTGGVVNYVNGATTYDGWLQIGRSGVAGVSQFDFSGGVINKVKGSGRVSIGESAATGILNMSGTAVLTPDGSGTKVVLSLTNAPGRACSWRSSTPRK